MAMKQITYERFATFDEEQSDNAVSSPT